jgi:ATP-binding protein involved in chromosome partitioning
VGVVSLGSVVPEGRALDFDSVEKGSSHLWRTTREFTAVGELLGSVEWNRLDYLLFDLPPGAERTQQFADYLGPETAFLLVSTPAGLSRAVVSRSLAALDTTSNPVLGYVENMSGYYCADCGAVKPLFPQDRQVELSLPCLGRVPFDPDLAAACDRGEAMEEEADRPTLAAIHAVADRIIHEVEADR